jgi:hypothetical protein
MKKIILGGIAAIVIAVLAAVNVNMNSQSENLLSDIALANVEALAQESGGISMCLGLWGDCILPDGTVSKAPAVHYQL